MGNKKPKKKEEIDKPKKDIRIEDGKPKFNSVLSNIVNKPKKKDEGTN